MRRAAAVLAGGVGLVLAALTFDATILFVPGVGFVLLGTLVPAWTWAAARATHVTRKLPRRTVIEGEPLEVIVQVAGPVWAPQAQVIDRVAGAFAAGGRREVTLTARFPRRGRVRLDPPRLRIADPLGLCEVIRAASCGPQEILVLPQTDPVGWVEYGGGASGDSARRAADEPWGASEVDGLRSYQPGTPASRIHWPALARGVGLLERRLRADGAAPPLVIVDPRSDGRLDHLDAAVRAAASLVLELGRRSGCELLLPGDRRGLRVGRDLATWPQAHARLALLEDDGHGGAPVLPQASAPVFYVAARRPDELELPATRQGKQPFLLVLARELWGGAPGAVRFSVAGCHGVQIDHQRSRTSAERAA